MSDRELEYSWRTDRGRVRAHNEDAVAVHPDIGLVAIADGIGGSNAGEVASRLAMYVIGESFRARASLPATKEEAADAARGAVLEANRVISDSGRRTPSYSGMGTTVVVGYVGPDWLVFAHVGDSRLYLLRDRQLHQLTRDHSLIQESVDQGFFPNLEEAKRYGIKQNILTRGLGSNSKVTVDAGAVELLYGDVFLFCTDGLSGMVADNDLRAALIRDAHQDLDDLGSHLVKLAYQGGGFDNITLAMIRVG